jgi:hypothetical protein
MQNEIIEIFNLNGQNIFNKMIDNSNSVELDLPSGIYFLRSNTKSGIYNSKIIIN